jgi:hypothetical protein
MTPTTTTIETASKKTETETNNVTKFNEAPLEHIPQSNKAATLTKLLKITKDSEQSSSSSSSPLKILREKSLSIGKPRLKILPSVGSESINSTTFLLDHDGENPCETPSYMASAQGNFNLEPKSIAKVEVEQNALPLPPKPKVVSSLVQQQKRHVRKYPLIIPATGIQRTLDKINQTTPVEEKQYDFQVPPEDAPNPVPTEINNADNVVDDDDDDDDVFEDLKKDTKILQEIEENVNSHYGKIKSSEKMFTRDFIENNFPDNLKRNSFVDVNGIRTYENLEAFQRRFSLDEQDTASLHFESIMENDEITSNKAASDDLVDGFSMFDNVNGTSSIKNEKEESRTDTPAATIEVKKMEFSQKFPKYKMPRNELASNALFNKIKQSVENASKFDECEVELEVQNDFDLKRSINHVSCEDLLDFSEMKPKGRERGVESDEVRIMAKMFGSKVSFT